MLKLLPDDCIPTRFASGPFLGIKSPIVKHAIRASSYSARVIEPLSVIYISDLGSDHNDGTTQANAVRSWSRASCLAANDAEFRFVGLKTFRRDAEASASVDASFPGPPVVKGSSPHAGRREISVGGSDDYRDR